MTQNAECFRSEIYTYAQNDIFCCVAIVCALYNQHMQYCDYKVIFKVKRSRSNLRILPLSGPKISIASFTDPSDFITFP